VAYCGEPGSYNHKAGLQYFGTDVSLQPCSSYRELFKSIENEEAGLGIIPLENSLTGSIHENYDLLLEYDLKIVGELILRIKHNLIGQKGASISGIQRVFAHPQVFEQCREFLNQYPTWDLVSCKDTVTGARRVKEGGDQGIAAITGEDAARMFQLAVLKEGIETNPRNFTRFGIIAKEEILEVPKNKSSLIYAVSDTPGALYETIKIFAKKRINLVKLESRPIPSTPWEYLFYVDLEADLRSGQHRNMLEDIQKKTKFFKFLGSYQKGAVTGE
jgi:prephenate dehydratase